MGPSAHISTYNNIVQSSINSSVARLCMFLIFAVHIWKMQHGNVLPLTIVKQSLHLYCALQYIASNTKIVSPAVCLISLATCHWSRWVSVGQFEFEHNAQRRIAIGMVWCRRV